MTEYVADSTQFASPAFEPMDLDEAVNGLSRRWTSGIGTIIVDRQQPSSQIAPGNDVISLRRLNRIIRLDLPNAAVIAEAGTTIEVIRETVGRHELWCPALRWLPGEESIGAAAAGGHGRRTRKYGAVGDYILGTRFICPAVGLTRHGGLAIKNATGYNLSGAVTGSRGRLAVILEVTLRLVPIPRCRSVRIFTTTSEHQVWETAQSLALPRLDDPAKAVVDRSLASIEAWATSYTSDSALAVEIEAGHPETDSAVVSAVERQAEARGLLATASTSWPPSEMPVTFETRRLAIDPAKVANTSARIRASVGNDFAMFMLAEMTGGALEVSFDRTSQWPPGFDPSEDPRDHRAGGAQQRAALKAAFDPRGLLREATASGDSNG